MNIKVEKCQLKFGKAHVNGLIFIPLENKSPKCIASFTHGFTSHKGSILTWPQKLLEIGVPSIIFDLPGHFIGSFCEVDTFEQFEQEAPILFEKSLDELKNQLNKLSIDTANIKNIVIGGHSLGGLISLLALEQIPLDGQEIRSICVGVGLPPVGQTHVFKSALFKDTIDFRSGLVSPALNPETTFPWIKKTKDLLNISRQTIHLLTGEDDIVVGKNGTERFQEVLDNTGNITSLEKPKRLSHHLPDMAGSYIKKYFQKEFNLS